MARHQSPLPFPNSPETWLSFFRRRAEAEHGIHLSPEEVGAKLGVSGATVRRWENGRAVPTEDDLAHFGELCGLSQQQIAFLRIAFRGRHAPLPPDHKTFRSTTESLLTEKCVPIVVFDELMYVRAWNSYMPFLGEQASILLHSELHPLERFFEAVESGLIDERHCATIGWKAIQTFWQFTAPYNPAIEYAELVARFESYPALAALWTQLPDNQTAVDRSGVARLLLPYDDAPRFSLVNSAYSYPPMYSIFEFHPEDDRAHCVVEKARAQGKPEVFFSTRDHWSNATCGPPIQHQVS